jgi:chitodextrinase
MKKYLQFIVLLFLVGLFAGQELLAQSRPFSVKTIFSTVNGETTPYPVYISLHTKTPDYGQKGVATVYEGEPSKEKVFNDIFGNADRGIGQFFLTDVKQNEPISFVVDYGYHNVDGDNRYLFDKLTYTYGDYKTNESVPKELARQDVAYDCNIVVQNCRVYQRHYFGFPRNEVHKNKSTAYAKSLILRFYKGGKVAKTIILPIVLMGKYSEFIVRDLGPHQVKTILRAVPGDNSFSFIEAEKSYSVDKVISASLTNSRTRETSEKVEAGFDKFGISGGASYESSSSTTSTTTNEETNATNFTYTSKGRITNKTKYDRFIVEKWKYDYYLQSNCSAVWYSNIVQVNMATSIGLVPVEKVRDLNYHENELLDTYIPRFKANQQDGEAKFWEDMIALNNKLKVNARRKGGFSNAKGTEEENTRQESTSVSYKQEVGFSQSKSKEITAKVGVEIGFFSAGVEATDKTTLTVETTNSTENAQGNSKTLTVGFSIDDDDDSDILNVDLLEDNGFGAPVFQLVGNSKTSCPFEGGQQIDKPTIQVAKYESIAYADSAKFSDIELGKEVIFTLKVKNNSESQSDRTYRVRYPNLAFQLPKIEFIGYSSPTPEFELPFGQEKTIDLIVKNVYPTEKGYEEILMIVEPICADQEARNDDGYAADTVKLEAYWGATDKNRAPDNNFATTALLLKSDGSLQTTYINKFNSEAKFTNINANSAEEEEAITPVNWNKENGSVPEITNSVWFKFVVSSPVIEVRLCDPINDGFNSQIAIYKVGNINDMSTYSILSSNDKGRCRTGNTINESAAVEMENLTLGDTLYVLVDGFKGAQSNFGITIESFPPNNDDNCKAFNLDLNNDVRKGTIIRGLSNYNATTEINESMLIPQASNAVYGWKEDEIQHSVWFRFSAPKEERVSIEILNATFDTQLAVYGNQASSGCANFDTFELLRANDDLDVEGGFNSKFTLKDIPYNPSSNRIYYYILVDGYKGAMGTFDLQVKLGLPENDLIENAITLQVDASGQGVFNNGGATTSDEEQVIAPPQVPLQFKNGWGDNEQDGKRIQTSVWFKFIAPAEGAVQISTCNQASFSNQLALYKIGDLANYSTYEYLGADDGGNQCRIPPSNQYPNGRNVRGSILNVTDLIGGETYYLLVDGNATSFGQFSIDLLTQKITEPPENDAPCDAIELPVNGEVQTGYNNFAATPDKSIKRYDITPSEWLDDDMDGTVWFTFTGPSSGEVEISTCDLANFDTQLAVFTLNGCQIDSTAVLMGANEDGPKSCATNGDSYLTLKNLTAGQKYYLVVDGFGPNKGNFSIVLKDQITPGPANDDVVNAILIPVDGKVKSGFSNAFATVREKEQDIRPKAAAQEPNCETGWCDDQVDNSVWFKFVAPSDGKVKISTCDLADFDTQLALYEATDVSDFSTFTLKAANDAGPEDCSTFFDSFMPVEGLTAGKTYYVLVDGFDGDNGKFSISLTGDVDTQAPTSPNDLTATTIETTSVDITWAASTDDRSVKEYVIYVNGTAVATVTGTAYSIKNLASETTYSITVVAKDEAGNSSTASTALSVTTIKAVDTQAPTSPNDLTATSIQQTTIGISWTPSTDDVSVKEYRVYVDGALIATTTTTSFTLDKLAAETAYSIYVIAVDEAGNASNASSALKVTTAKAPDTQAPTSPTGLTATDTQKTTIGISWTASTDNVAVKEYKIYVDGTLKSSTSGTAFSLDGLTAGTAYSIYVVAVDEAGNSSAASTALKVTTLANVVADTAAPSTATSLTASEITTSSVKVSWNAATDNVGVTEYQLFVDGTQNSTTTTTSTTISGLTKATAYSIYVTAKDAAGNTSAASEALKVTTLDVEIVGIEPDLTNQYLVYPNPFTDRIILEYPGNQLKKGDIEVYNLEGQYLLTPLFKARGINKVEVDLKPLVSGTHIILIKKGTKTVFKKVIKQ